MHVRLSRGHYNLTNVQEQFRRLPGCALDADYQYFRLAALEEQGVGHVAKPPFSTRILLENLLRQEDGRRVSAADVDYVARAKAGSNPKEISFMPARVLLQDFTGVPCVVDLAAMRDALAAMGVDPAAPTRCCRPTW